MAGDRERTAGQFLRLIRVATCVPVLTLVFLLGLEIYLRQGNPVDRLGYRSVDIWNLANRVELCRKTKPELALVGSSLLLVLNQDKTGTHFYTGSYPPYLQSLLRKACGDDVSCINLCSGMQMVPEAYMVSEAVTNAEAYPKVIVYGIALREFVDFTYSAEWTGEGFNSLSAYVKPDPFFLYNLYSVETIREFLLCHYSYIYRDRNDLKFMLSGMTKNWLENLPLDQHFTRMGNDHSWKPQKEGYLMETWIPRRMEKFGEEVYRKNPEFLRNYYMKYQKMMYQRAYTQRDRLERGLGVQQHYFKNLIELCEKKKIFLVVVDMPMSKEFISLAPPGFYDSFKAFLKEGADNNKFILIDLVDDPDFDNTSYKDGVHLSYPGARLLAEKLTAIFKEKYPGLLEAMERQHKLNHR